MEPLQGIQVLLLVEEILEIVKLIILAVLLNLREIQHHIIANFGLTLNSYVFWDDIPLFA